MSQSFISHRTGSLPSPLHIGGGGVEGGWGWGSDVGSSISTASPDSHWCEGEKGPPQLWQFSSLLEGRMGEVLRVSLSSEEVSRNFSGELRALCDFPMWIFKPFLVLNTVSHWSHWNVWFSAKACWLVSRSAWFSSEEGVDFFSGNCFLRLAFLFLVEGLVLFFPALGMGTVLSPESREKEKVLPMVRENLKALPWLFSAWQRARHLLAREELFSLTPAIFAFTSEVAKRVQEPEKWTCCHFLMFLDSVMSEVKSLQVCGREKCLPCPVVVSKEGEGIIRLGNLPFTRIFSKEPFFYNLKSASTLLSSQ